MPRRARVGPRQCERYGLGGAETECVLHTVSLWLPLTLRTWKEQSRANMSRGMSEQELV